MSQLVWNATGQKFFEAGVDRGVLFPKNQPGVAWNGLISVKESSTGGEPTAYYLDGVKYMNIPAREEFQGTIEAYTAPDQFAECDGTLEIYDGLFVHQQRRKPFDLSYRTGLGNDLEGLDHGYKIHVVYNALAAPSGRSNDTLTESSTPMTLSWAFTTTPVLFGTSAYPTAHIAIDSTKTEPTLLADLEATFYGTDDSEPTLLTVDQILAKFLEWHTPLEITEALSTGLAGLSRNIFYDLNGNINVGLYRRPRLSRLEPEAVDGLFDLET